MLVRTVLLSALLLCAAGAPLSAQRHVLQGDDVAVYNLVGTISVTGSAGREVVVDVAARGRDARVLRIETGRVAGSDALRVFADSDRIIYPALSRGTRSTLRVNRDGTFPGGGVLARARNVTVSGSGSGDEAYADISVLLPPGRTLRLFAAVGRVEVSNVEGAIHVHTSAARTELSDVQGTVELRTSSGGAALAGIRGDVQVRSSSGSVAINEARGGRYSIRSSSGSINARGLTAGDVQLSASSGSITAQRIAAAATEVSTSSGSIRLDDLRGDRLSAQASSGRIEARGVAVQQIELRASSGSVTVAAVGTPHSLAVRTSSGSVRATVPAGFGGDVDIRTGSGGIRSELPVVVQASSRSQLTGHIGDGSGSLRIRTSSGSVRLNAN